MGAAEFLGVKSFDAPGWRGCSYAGEPVRLAMMKGDYADIVIAGGGLSGALAALALAKAHPELRLKLIDAGETPGSTRIWPCFLTDIPASDRWLVEPLFEGTWRKYEVRFPRFMRVVNTPCRMISGERIAAALHAALPEGALIAGAAIAGLDAAGVTLANGRRIHARAVIDARAGTIFPHLSGGWRISHARVVRFAHKHPFAHPLLMDLRISQREGFRYISCVPVTAHIAYICETQLTETPSSDAGTFDPAAQGARIEEYCRLANWDVAEVLSEQSDILPLVGGGDFDAFWAAGESGVARIGVWAGLLHPFAGTKIGPAVRAALALAEVPELSQIEGDGPDLFGQALSRASRDIAARHWRGTGFARMLTRLMFSAARARRRYKLCEGLYRLDQAPIERFYANASPLSEQIKILLATRLPFRRLLGAALGGSSALAPLDGDELTHYGHGQDAFSPWAPAPETSG